MNRYDYYFPVFKGMQKPLEFMGLRGRFIVLAAAGIGIGFLGYVILMMIFGQIIGISFLAIAALVSFVTMKVKQKQGLHNKKKSRDCLVYHYLFKQ